MLKTLNKLGIKGNFVNMIIKAIYEESTANIPNDVGMKAFLLGSGTNKNACFPHFCLTGYWKF